MSLPIRGLEYRLPLVTLGFLQGSEKEATKQRISELEEMVIQLKDQLAEKVNPIRWCKINNTLRGYEIPIVL